jgi:hypothetical protein
MSNKETGLSILLLFIAGCNAIDEQPVTANSAPTHPHNSYDTLSSCRKSQKKKKKEGKQLRNEVIMKRHSGSGATQR